MRPHADENEFRSLSSLFKAYPYFVLRVCRVSFDTSIHDARGYRAPGSQARSSQVRYTDAAAHRHRCPVAVGTSLLLVQLV